MDGSTLVVLVALLGTMVTARASIWVQLVVHRDSEESRDAKFERAVASALQRRVPGFRRRQWAQIQQYLETLGVEQNEDDGQHHIVLRAGFAPGRDGMWRQRWFC